MFADRLLGLSRRGRSTFSVLFCLPKLFYNFSFNLIKIELTVPRKPKKRQCFRRTEFIVTSEVVHHPFVGIYPRMPKVETNSLDFP